MQTKPLSVALLSAAIFLALLPQASEAACFLSCRCSDRNGYGSSRSYGPFDSTAACNAAVSNFTMQCKSGNQAHWFTASCSPGCFNCEPPTPAAPSGNDSAKTQTPAPAQQSNWDEYRKAQEAKEQRQFEQEKGKLLQEIKGVDVGGANEIRLMAPPSGSVLRQLECANEQSRGGNLEGHGKDLTHSSACNTALPNVPPVSAPVAAESKGKIPQLQLDLQQRIAGVRQKLARQDNEIVRLEQVVQAEETKKPELKKVEKEAPTEESAALLKARQALAKAKADRARTASELTKLEKQEAAASGEAR
jgi:hypothetical protein